MLLLGIRQNIETEGILTIIVIKWMDTLTNGSMDTMATPINERIRYNYLLKPITGANSLVENSFYFMREKV